VTPSPFVSFEEAITDKLLFKVWYEQLSPMQQTVLRAYYGLPITTDAHRFCWAVLNNSCQEDELGYPVEVREFPYSPKEYEQLWAVIGRRGGKTTMIGALVFAYECTLGGHLDYVLPGQTPRAVLISQMKDVAIENLVSIKLCLESSPLGTREISQALSDCIVMKNGISIVASSPNIKAQRGLAIPVVGMDEVGFWYKEAESANPDYEVERAVSAAQAQFPRRKRFGISTPWSKEGLLYKYHGAGTEGRRLREDEDRTEFQDILVVHATTAAMTVGMEGQKDAFTGKAKRPQVERKFLVKERARDLAGFIREYLARFVDSVSAFIQRAALETCTLRHATRKDRTQDLLWWEPRPRAGVPEDAGLARPIYVAAIDPAFRRDAFGFCVVHHEPGVGIVVDKAKRYLPQANKKLNPSEVLADLLPDLQAYGVTHVFSDQYQLEALTQLFSQLGIVLEGVDFTQRSKALIMGNLESLINQGRLHLLDPKCSPVAQEMFDELLALEKVLRPNGTVSIAAPPTGWDDMAIVLGLAAYRAMWLTATPDGAPELPEEHKPRSLFQRVLAMLTDRKDMTAENDQWD
jgi:hypothetical protein